MSLDTATPLTDLIQWHERRGYRQWSSWQGKTYDLVFIEEGLRP